jgi:hypothetical protein
MSKTILVAMWCAAPVLLGQTSAKEPDTMQSLLMEMHQLRQDIEAMTVASQRVQIALYTLQMQDAAVGRTTQRLDDARNRCKGEDGNRQHTASEIQRLESNLASGRVPETEVKLMFGSRLGRILRPPDLGRVAVVLVR